MWTLHAALWLLALVPRAALAGDPVAGMALFSNIPDAIISCGNSSCHGPNPNDNVNRLQRAGNNAGVIEAAIRVNVQQMMFLNGLLNPFQLDDLAAYLAPQPDLSAVVLDFGTQPTGTQSAPQSVTLSDLGGVDLVLTGVTVSGPNTASFTVSGDCAAGIVLKSAVIDDAGAHPGGRCSVIVAFAPSGAGTQAAAVTLSYAGTTTFPAKQTIALAGSGAAPQVPVAALDRAALDFGEILREATAPKQRVTLSNPGTGRLQITGIENTGLHGGEFGVSGTCVSFGIVEVAPGGSCFVDVGFSPQGLGSRAGRLLIRYSAAGSPALVSLTGFGLAPTCAPPAPSPEFQTLACLVGQNGSITQSRAAICMETSWTPGPWVTVANNCRANNPAAPLTLIEFYNAPLDHYFITANAVEAAGIEAGLAGPGWSRKETLGGVWEPVALPGVIPVCRFYGNPATGPGNKRLGPNSHFYTADAAECEAVKADPGWVFEGIVFQVVAAQGGECTPPLRAVRRSYNGRFRENDSNHRYATDAAIVAQMSARGWADEGIVFCVAAP